MASLMGTRIVIAGGSSGIGLGVAAAALGKGANVVIVGRSPERLAAAVGTLGSAGVTAVAADMTEAAGIARAFAGIGAFDHLVSTAGPLPPNDPVDRTDAEVARRFVDGKLIGSLLLAGHAVPHLRRGGSITFTSGINKDKPPVPGGALVAAVAGSFGPLVHALALELGPTRVNVVSPGWVDTPMFDTLAGEAKAGYFGAMAAQLPVGRVATPADMAAAYLYAMESDFTTGETLHIDGGQRLL